MACILCKEPFTDKNVYSAAGWCETKITQMCELCFDKVTKEPEEYVCSECGEWTSEEDSCCGVGPSNHEYERDYER